MAAKYAAHRWQQCAVVSCIALHHANAAGLLARLAGDQMYCEVTMGLCVYFIHASGKKCYGEETESTRENFY